MEIVIILVIALVVFGPKRLPELGQAIGRSIREFRQATQGLTHEVVETAQTVTEPVQELKSSILPASGEAAREGGAAGGGSAGGPSSPGR